MTKKTTNDEASDRELFQQATSGVKQLKQPQKMAAQPNKKNIRVNRNRPDIQSHGYSLSDSVEGNLSCSPDEILSYRGNGVQQRFFKKLKNGELSIHARLDLHGFTIDNARDLVSDFICECLELQLRCIIIVHGKGSRGGQPILKPMVDHWLKQIPDVLAYHSAQPKDGGTGAVYVLLKNTDKK